MKPLTYLAHLRQKPALTAFLLNKKDNLKRILASIMHHFSLIESKGNYGGSDRETVTIGIAPGADLDAQNRNTDEWLRDASNLPNITRYIFSLSHAGERKYQVNTPMNTTGSGLTGFWMRFDPMRCVKVVNGTMYPLLKGKSADTLTRILSPRIALLMLSAKLYADGEKSLMVADKVSQGQHIGLYGLKSGSRRLVWVSNITSRKLKAQRGQVDMSQNTFSSQPSFQLIGLRDGSALDTVRAFQNRRKGKQTP